MGKYDDMLNLPHHVSNKHPQMPRTDRAAQFAPFAALTGYGDQLEETARLTEMQREPDENEKAELDMILQYLEVHRDEKIQVIVTYFVEDALKPGGMYTAASGIYKKTDAYERNLVLTDGIQIPLDAILKIELTEEGN